MPTGQNQNYAEETIYPEELGKCPRRHAILKRNEWMIENSDTGVIYVISPAGGAVRAKEFAIRKGKRIAEIR